MKKSIRIIISIISSSILTSILILSIFLPTQPYYSDSLRIDYSIELKEVFADFYFEEFSKEFFLIPFGRISSLDHKFTFYLNGKDFIPTFITDDCGAQWINLSFRDYNTDLTIDFTRTRVNGPIEYYQDNEVNITKWLSPAEYIDSDNISIISLANNLVQDQDSNLEKARSIFKYVDKKIHNKDSHIPNLNASKVLNLGFGVCRDQARLFVALCRSANIPSRTISGFIAKDFDSFNSLHLWSEIRLEDGTWIQVCPTNSKFDFSDVCFVDCMYSNEDSSIDFPLNSSSPNFSIEYNVNLETKVFPLKYSLNKLSYLFDVGVLYMFVFMIFSYLILDEVVMSKIKNTVEWIKSITWKD